jgi:hypothetical protein
LERAQAKEAVKQQLDSEDEMEFTIFYALSSAYEGTNWQYLALNQNSLGGVEGGVRVGDARKPGEYG